MLAQYLFRTLVVGSLLTACAVPVIAMDQKLMIAREAILESSPAGVTLDPHVITPTQDGGFLAAGTSGQQGWAIKTDADGSALWRYIIGLRDELPPADSPTFDGAVVMPDGSSYLCGFMPAPPGKYQPALITHLDPAGHALYERLLTPKNAGEHSLAYLNNVVRLNDDIALLGHVISFSSGKEQHFYWILVLNSQGQTKWEKLFPTDFDRLLDIGPLIVEGNALFFSGVNFATGSEVFGVDANGDLLAQVMLPGELLSFSLASSSSDGVLQMYGYQAATGLLETIMLDRRLKITDRRRAKQRFEFDPSIAYRTKDHSLIIFGIGRGEQGRQRILLLDSTLQSAKFFGFPSEKYDDFTAVKAVAPTTHEGEYVAARPLLARIAGTSGVHTKFSSVGAILDFLKVQ